VLGLPDPADKTGQRGVAGFDFRSIWVNDHGRRFTPEFGDEKVNLRALFGKINGRAALEGTFLGPCILIGRIAARAAVHPSTVDRKLRALPAPAPPANYANEACTGCPNLQRLTKRQRSGYWHFEQSHAKALDRHYRCGSCHQSMFPFMAGNHKEDRLALVNACHTCHSANQSNKLPRLTIGIPKRSRKPSDPNKRPKFGLQIIDLLKKGDQFPV